jgi:putative acetyltransferase
MRKTLPFSWATPTDAAELADVMFDAVRNGPSKYTDAQRAAWVPERRRYIDFAFIRPEAQGSGLFRRLFELVEAHARAANEARLWVHASLMAQPAFAAVGFSVVEHQNVQIGDQIFQRAMMEKPLVTPI